MAFFEALKSKAKTQSKTVTAGTNATTVVPDSGYDGLSDVTVNPTPSQEKTITPSLSSRTVTPDSGKLLSKVTVNAYTPTGNANASDVLSGKTFMNVNGAQTGSMTNNGAVSGTATPSQPYTIPAGYHNGGGKVTASGSSDIMPTDTYCHIGYTVAESAINEGPIVSGVPITLPTTYAATFFNVKNFSSMTIDATAALGATRIAFHSDGTVTAITGSTEIDLSSIDYIMVYTQGARVVTFTA